MFESYNLIPRTGNRTRTVTTLRTEGPDSHGTLSRRSRLRGRGDVRVPPITLNPFLYIEGTCRSNRQSKVRGWGMTRRVVGCLNCEKRERTLLPPNYMKEELRQWSSASESFGQEFHLGRHRVPQGPVTSWLGRTRDGTHFRTEVTGTRTT